MVMSAFLFVLQAEEPSSLRTGDTVAPYPAIRPIPNVNHLCIVCTTGLLFVHPSTHTF